MVARARKYLYKRINFLYIWKKKLPFQPRFKTSSRNANKVYWDKTWARHSLVSVVSTLIAPVPSHPYRPLCTLTLAWKKRPDLSDIRTGSLVTRIHGSSKNAVRTTISTLFNSSNNGISTNLMKPIWAVGLLTLSRSIKGATGSPSDFSRSLCK